MANLSLSPLAARCCIAARQNCGGCRSNWVPASTHLDHQLRGMAEVLQAIAIAKSFDNLSRPPGETHARLPSRKHVRTGVAAIA
jgi:hypothetical protein